MSNNGSEFQLFWEGWADPIDLLEIAQVVRQEDHKLIGTIQFIRKMFEDRIILQIELIGEEEFGLDPVEAREKAEELMKQLKNALPPETKLSISRHGAFLTFLLIDDLNVLRHEIESPAQLTALLLPRIAMIMKTHFKNHEFNRTLVK